MPDNLPALSQAEWLLMKICWGQDKSTARQVYEEARKQRKWEYQTVKTMLDRLAGKGYLRKEKLGPLCLYQSKVPQSKTTAKAIENFVDTVLDNTFAPLFAHLAKGKKLSDEEIASLREIIEQQGED